MAIPVLDNGQLGLGLGPEAGQVQAEVGLQGPAVELVLRQHFAGFWLEGGSVLHDGRRGTHRYFLCWEGLLYSQVGVAWDEARLRPVGSSQSHTSSAQLLSSTGPRNPGDSGSAWEMSGEPLSCLDFKRAVSLRIGDLSFKDSKAASVATGK